MVFLPFGYPTGFSIPLGAMVTAQHVNRPERNAHHSLPPSTKVTNTWSYTSTIPYAFK
jgi:hypothetical protein